MKADQHLFISYAHLDNEPLAPGQPGWISRFHATLDALLSMRLGRKAEIWRDEKLQGNDVFEDEIVARFKRTAVLVSVVTSRYLNSEWCTREVREFCEQAELAGGLTVANKSRVFKVVKTPLEDEHQLPTAIREVLGYEFFTVEDGTPFELDPAYGPEFEQLYHQKVAKLAWEMAQILKAIEATADVRAGEEVPTKVKPAVYLAECSYDRKTQREQIEAELRRLGYPVFPDTRLPSDEGEYVTAVESLLAQCALSIHLVGQSYGAVPDGPTMKSASMLQNELAVARSTSNGLARLIWLPRGTHAEHPPQQAFIQALHEDAETQRGADLITGDQEELRTAIHNTLDRIEKPPPQARDVDEDSQGSSARLVYLICDERDRKATIPVRKHLRERCLEVALPAFEGDAARVREANRELLASCDAVLVFYGAGDEAWKRTVVSELKKMAGYRQGKAVLARHTYLAAPRTGDKEDLLDMEEPDHVDGLSGFDESALAPFVKAVTGATPGT